MASSHSVEGLYEPGGVRANLNNLFIGEPNSNGECHFRSVTWTPEGSSKRLPFTFQTRIPVELLRGIIQQGSTGEEREAINLNLSVSGFCPILRRSIRQVERAISKKLTEIGDPKPLLSQRLATADGDNSAMMRVPIKASHPCLSIQVSEGEPREVPLANFKGRSGLYHCTIQLTSLFSPRTSQDWRVSYVLRALTLVDQDPKHLPSFAQALRPYLLHTTTTAASRQTDDNDTASRSPSPTTPPAKKRRQPTVARKPPVKRQPPAIKLLPPETKTAIPEEQWLECPPAKNLVSAIDTTSSSQKSKAASKNLALVRQQMDLSSETEDDEDCLTG